MPIQGLRDITPPGSKPTGVNAPSAPGVGVPQPTAAEKSATEARFAALRDKPLPKDLAELIVAWDDAIRAHPEYLEWARWSVSGVMGAK